MIGKQKVFQMDMISMKNWIVKTRKINFSEYDVNPKKEFVGFLNMFCPDIAWEEFYDKYVHNKSGPPKKEWYFYYRNWCGLSREYATRKLKCSNTTISIWVQEGEPSTGEHMDIVTRQLWEKWNTVRDQFVGILNR